MRLHIVVEGQTEEEVVEHVIAPHLAVRGVWASAIKVTTSRDPVTGVRRHRGGGFWGDWARDLHILTREHRRRDDRFTTLFDLYGLPEDFPDLAVHSRIQDTAVRAERLEESIRNAVGDWRLIPYLQLHEMEALVLASLDELEKLIDPEDRGGFADLRVMLAALPPEQINDGKETAPSKRLAKHIPGYRKTTHGPQAIKVTGLPTVRQRCPRFDAWLTTLEQL